MTFVELKNNQPEVMKILDNSYDRKKLVHAYIFEGEAGTGKLDASLYLAAKLLCREEEKPCMSCASCNRVINNSHINVNIIEPIDGVIKKEQVTNLLKEVSMKTLEKGARIHIIKDADKLNQSSSNALLKFIEEPFPNNYIILTTENANKLLNTIVSRSQVLHFKPIKKEILETKLIENGVNKDMAFVISNLTSNIDQANTLINEGLVTTIMEMIKKLFLTENAGKDKYVTYLLSNTNLPKKDNKFNRLFFEIYTLFLEEKIHYIESKAPSAHFMDAFKNMDIYNADIKDITRQLDVVCEYEKRLNNYPNVELMYASLFLEL